MHCFFISSEAVVSSLSPGLVIINQVVAKRKRWTGFERNILSIVETTRAINFNAFRLFFSFLLKDVPQKRGVCGDGVCEWTYITCERKWMFIVLLKRSIPWGHPSVPPSSSSLLLSSCWSLKGNLSILLLLFVLLKWNPLGICGV